MKRVLALALCLMMVAGLLPQMAAGAAKYSLTFEYPSALCDVFATVANTDDPVYRSGDSVDAGTYLAYRIEDIADGYRIKSVMLNGQDRTSGFVNGAYGMMATSLNANATLKVELEKIPEVLPEVESVTVYLDQKLTQLADAYTTVDADTRFYGKASYSDGVTYPSYFVGGVWEYSVDGVNWIQDTAWGVNTFNYWPGWSHRLNFDPETHELLVNGSYDLRMRVTVREGYSTGEDVLSNVIHVNGGAAVEIVDEGTCGENVTWKLDAAGTLTISGEGPMKDFGSGVNKSPWEFSSVIKTVVIEEGVTSVGKQAFNYCSRLSKIVLPEGLTTIGQLAFWDCNSLKEIHFPSTLTAFDITAIDACDGLENITVADGNPNYSAIDGVLFHKDQTVLMRYPCAKQGETYTVPERVTTIAEGAFFQCVNLTEIKLPDSVTCIENSAFMECDRLARITIPAGVTGIENGTFSYCYALSEMIIPEGVTYIGARAFISCNNLTRIMIPDSVTSIGESAFCYCNSFTDVYYGGTEEQWEAVTVWDYNDELLNAEIHYNASPSDLQLLGDVNLDGAVDVSDAVLVFQHSMLPDLYPIEYTGSVDFNKDGVVDVSDAVLLFQYSMLPDLYPIG